MRCVLRNLAKIEIFLEVGGKSGVYKLFADSNIKCKNNQRERKKSFLGERKFNLALGLSLILNCTALIKSSSREEKTVFLGIYCLISLFAFSMAPFCQEE